MMNKEQLTINRAGAFGFVPIACYVFSIILLLSACPSPYSHKGQDNFRYSIPEGKGAFSLTADVSVPRTILPNTPNVNEFRYTLRFTSADVIDPPSFENMSKDDIKVPFYLDPGTYSLEVTAFIDNILVAKGSASGITIEPGKQTSREIILRAITDAEYIGSFTYTITFPQGVTHVEMVIQPLDEKTGSPGISDPVKIEGNTVSGSIEKLKTGYYSVVFTLEKNNKETIEWRELLRIYANLESVFTYEFTDEHFNNPIHVVTFIQNKSQEFTLSAMHGYSIEGFPSDITWEVDHYLYEGNVTTNDGFDFIDWYTDNTYDTPWDNEKNRVTGDITLYAKWDGAIDVSAMSGNNYFEKAIAWFNENAAYTGSSFTLIAGRDETIAPQTLELADTHATLIIRGNGTDMRTISSSTTGSPVIMLHRNIYLELGQNINLTWMHVNYDAEPLTLSVNASIDGLTLYAAGDTDYSKLEFSSGWAGSIGLLHLMGVAETDVTIHDVMSWWNNKVIMEAPTTIDIGKINLGNFIPSVGDDQPIEQSHYLQAESGCFRLVPIKAGVTVNPWKDKGGVILNSRDGEDFVPYNPAAPISLYRSSGGGISQCLFVKLDTKEEIQDIEWYVWGMPIGKGRGETKIVIDAADYYAGTYQLTAKVTIDGIPYSPDEIKFKVTDEPNDPSGSNPYVYIYNSKELQSIGKATDSQIEYRLWDDMTISGSWMSIGTDYASPFNATFNGNNKTITFDHVGLGSTSNYYGLFGYVTGTIKNLNLEGEIGLDNTYTPFSIALVGAAAGHVDDSPGAKIEKITSSVNMNITAQGANVGGIAGASYVDIIDCTNTGEITITAETFVNAGGITGDSYGNITECDSTGSITVDNAHNAVNVGGIAGVLNDTYEIAYCNSSGIIKVDVCDNEDGVNVGGIANTINTSGGSSIAHCSSTAEINITTTKKDELYTGSVYVGGIAGQSNEISNCSSEGDITVVTVAPTVMVGGITGVNYDAIGNSCSTSAISVVASEGDAFVGGITGNGYGEINQCFYDGSSIDGNSITVESGGNSAYAGGIVGCGRFGMADCYSAGNIKVDAEAGNTYAGGIAGTVSRYQDDIYIWYCYSSTNIEVVADGSATAGGIIGSFSGISYGTPIDLGLSNCVALNGEIRTSGTSTALYRIGDMYDGNFYSCYAWSDLKMYDNNGEIPVSDDVATGKDGEDITAAQYYDEEWWTDSGFWDEIAWDVGTWEIQNGSLPTLQNCGVVNGIH